MLVRSLDMHLNRLRRDYFLARRRLARFEVATRSLCAMGFFQGQQLFDGNYAYDLFEPMLEPGRDIHRRRALRISTPTGFRYGASCQFRPSRVPRLVPRNRAHSAGSSGEPSSSTSCRQ